MTTRSRHSLIWLNVGLRALVEIGLATGLGYWGWHTGTDTWQSWGLAVAAPAVGFGIWGAVDFHQLGRYAEPARLLEEVGLAGLTVIALAAAGRPGPATAFAGISLAHYVLVYAVGNRLLDRTRQTRPVPATG